MFDDQNTSFQKYNVIECTLVTELNIFYGTMGSKRQFFVQTQLLPKVELVMCFNLIFVHIQILCCESMLFVCSNDTGALVK